MRNCIDEGTLQTWFDGELSADAAASITAHIKACARCAEAARALEAENLIVFQALSAEFTQPVPTERLRQRVDAAVAGLHSARVPAVNESRWVAVMAFFASFRLLAYASVAAVILLAALLGFVYLKRQTITTAPASTEAKRDAIPTPPQATPEQHAVTVADKSNQSKSPRVARRATRTAAAAETTALIAKQERDYQTTIAQLNESFQSKPPLRPSLRVEYEYNLALIDNAIAATRDVARKNPKDPQAAQFMLAAYQSKVDLMNQFDELRVLAR